jgi:acetylglutamate kinase
MNGKRQKEMEWDEKELMRNGRALSGGSQRLFKAERLKRERVVSLMGLGEEVRRSTTHSA